ncbi:MAG: DUF4143 domain-containing protein [Demequina sp.]|nr:DUF4143 domain-containing protein [Demequina sp.]
MATGLQKHSGSVVRSRGSIPKLQVFNTALMTAMRPPGEWEDLRPGDGRWGRYVESAVGAHLVNAAAAGQCRVEYWRERNHEVDYVLTVRGKVTAIEVKSGTRAGSLPGIQEFLDVHGPARPLLVGGGGIPVDEFLSIPVSEWGE